MGRGTPPAGGIGGVVSLGDSPTVAELWCRRVRKGYSRLAAGAQMGGGGQDIAGR